MTKNSEINLSRASSIAAFADVGSALTETSSATTASLAHCLNPFHHLNSVSIQCLLPVVSIVAVPIILLFSGLLPGFEQQDYVF